MALLAMVILSPRYTGAAARLGSASRRASAFSRWASRKAFSRASCVLRRSWCSRSASSSGSAAGSFSARGSAAGCTRRVAESQRNQSLPTRQMTLRPSAPKRGSASASVLRVSCTSGPPSTRRKTSPLRMKTACRRLGSNTGRAASSSARAAPSTFAGSPPATGTVQVSRTGLPSRLSVYSARWPSSDHQADSTGGPIQSGWDIALSSVSGSWASAGRAQAVTRARTARRSRMEAPGVKSGRQA